MKKIITLIFSLTCIMNMFGTTQARERLVFRGDTVFTYIGIPNGLVDLSRDTSFYTNVNKSWNTACIDYRCAWLIENNNLFLTEIYSCSDYSMKADFNKVYSGTLENDKIKCFWLSDTIFAINKNNPRQYEDYSQVYNGIELRFVFHYGNLVSFDTVDNTSVIVSQTFDSITEWIFSHICWDSIPYLEQNRTIYIELRSNLAGKLEVDNIVRGDGEHIDRAISPMIHKSFAWNKIFRRGKPVFITWTIPFLFSEETRQKYAKKYK